VTLPEPLDGCLHGRLSILLTLVGLPLELKKPQAATALGAEGTRPGVQRFTRPTPRELSSAPPAVSSAPRV
jgi:hypothetical protein